jgi:hypothetical protein
MRAAILAVFFVVSVGCGELAPTMTVDASGDLNAATGQDSSTDASTADSMAALDADADPGGCTSDEECSKTYAGQNGASRFPYCVKGSCQENPPGGK